MRPITRKGFGLVDALILLAFVLLLLMAIAMAIASIRRESRMAEHTKRIRGIHSGFVLSACGNNTYYPGLNHDAEPDVGSRFFKSIAAHPLSVEGRYAFLLEHGFFTGDSIISPFETKTAWTAGQVIPSNYSYAMMRVDMDKPHVVGEWRDTLNSEAVSLGDRLVEGTRGRPETYRSILPAKSRWWARPGWRGALGWNDNHVSLSVSPIVATEYNRRANKADDVFVAEGDADAMLIHQGR
jgi:hypothetical protein